jgi:hypothetical protein
MSLCYEHSILTPDHICRRCVQPTLPAELYHIALTQGCSKRLFLTYHSPTQIACQPIAPPASLLAQFISTLSQFITSQLQSKTDINKWMIEIYTRTEGWSVSVTNYESTTNATSVASGILLT